MGKSSFWKVPSKADVTLFSDAFLSRTVSPNKNSLRQHYEWSHLLDNKKGSYRYCPSGPVQNEPKIEISYCSRRTECWQRIWWKIPEMICPEFSLGHESLGKPNKMYTPFPWKNSHIIRHIKFQGVNWSNESQSRKNPFLWVKGYMEPSNSSESSEDQCQTSSLVSPYNIFHGHWLVTLLLMKTGSHQTWKCFSSKM